jgi:hypothetical protein
LFSNLCNALLIEGKLGRNYDCSALIENVLSGVDTIYHFERKKSIKLIETYGVPFDEVLEFRKSQIFKSIINEKIGLITDLKKDINGSKIDALYFNENGILYQQDLVLFKNDWSVLRLMSAVFFIDEVKAVIVQGPWLMVSLDEFYKSYMNFVDSE